MLGKLMEHRGAVSVFLVIILVPMIVCASLFVDAARVQSARGVVKSAGDLTLNTVLSQYDVDLNDFYGLMTSCQDMNDVLDAAGDYFAACVKSQGIDTTQSAKYINSIKGFFFGDDDVYDLLGIGLKENSKVSVSPVADGNLTNPAIAKTQIVEFMKYRSPINAVVSLFEKFKKSSTELENSEKTADLVDKKQDYFEAQGEVVKKAYEIYENICKYEELGITKEELTEIKNFINGLPNQYNDIYTICVKDQFNTNGLSDGSIQYCVNMPTEYTHNANYENVQQNAVNKQIDSLMRICNQLINAKNTFEKEVAQPSTYYDVQYWAYCCRKADKFSAVSNKANELKNSFINLWDMIEHAQNGVTDEKYTSTFTGANIGVSQGDQKKVSEWFEYLKVKVQSALDSVASSSSRYYKTVYAVKNTPRVYERINRATNDQKLSNIYNKLKDYSDRYEKAFDLLGKIAKGCSELKKKVNEADEKFDIWEGKVNEYSSSGIELAKSDKQELVKAKEDFERIEISYIESYSSHVNNVKSALGTIKDGLSKIKWNGNSIIDKGIDCVQDLKTYSNITDNDINASMYEADLNDLANRTRSFDMSGVNIQSLNYTANNDPKITCTIEENKYPLYVWMLKQGFDQPKNKDDEDKYDKKKEEADEKAKGAEEDVGSVASTNDISSLPNLPSGGGGLDPDAGKVTTKIKEVSTFVSKLFKNFGSTMSQAGVDIRDDLFVLDYITSMFTWQTFEYEAKYNMLSPDKQKSITFANAKESGYYGGLSSEWKSTEVTQTFNKTLTNKLRNSASTNWSYCNEVEYIMYGKDIDASKKALNGTIYMIRFALNIADVFKTFYNDEGLIEFAALINTATHGIVPAFLVKIVICLGLTALESAWDLKTLKMGIPVILVKTKKEDLFVTSWTFIPVRDNPETDKTKAVTFSYSDYMKLILFLKLLGSEADGIYLRTMDVVQTNMQKCVLKDGEYLLKNSNVYYQITANCTVRPLMLDTGYVAAYMPDALERMDKWNDIKYKSVKGY